MIIVAKFNESFKMHSDFATYKALKYVFNIHIETSIENGKFK